MLNRKPLKVKTKKQAKQVVRLIEEDNKTKEKSAIDFVLTWGFNPNKIEKEVEETPFTEEEKEIIKKAKF